MLLLLKFLIGLASLPLLAALTHVFAGQFNPGHDLTRLDTTTSWFIGGFVIWLLLFFMFPHPVRTYVLAHELTHALWGMLMGARVSKLRVSSKGGSVNLTKTNVWITLAPYFFPFYSILALALYALLDWRWDMTVYKPFWYAVFGMTWSFHLTFTVAMLGLRQPDVMEHGRLFSYALIYGINIVTAMVLLNMLTGRPLKDLPPEVARRTQATYQWTLDQLDSATGSLQSRW